jgi:hypothetical protein
MRADDTKFSTAEQLLPVRRPYRTVFLAAAKSTHRFRAVLLRGIS